MCALPGLAIPQSFRDQLAGRAAAGGVVGCNGDEWLRRLPGLLADCAERWRLHSAGRVWHGATALVVACRQQDRAVVVKLSWPHPEARHEHLALRHWNGGGAVHLLAADPAHWALLLERLDGDRTLASAPLLEACTVIGGLHRVLDRPAAAPFERIEDRAPAWLDRLRRGSPGVPRRLTDHAASALADLLRAPLDRLVHEDLHFDNVLAADRAPWLAIDPKPLAAEWAYAVAPVLWNRWDEATAARRLRAHLRLRAAVLADASGLDEDRVHAWSLVRCTHDAVEQMQQPVPDLEHVSRLIVVAKAMAG